VYLYVKNDPLIIVDPMGEFAQACVIGYAATISAVPAGAIIVGAATIGGTVYIVYKICETKPWKWKCTFWVAVPAPSETGECPKIKCIYWCEKWGGLITTKIEITVPESEGCPDDSDVSP
jgi:hypothetical protein